MLLVMLSTGAISRSTISAKKKRTRTTVETNNIKILCFQQFANANLRGRPEWMLHNFDFLTATSRNESWTSGWSLFSKSSLTSSRPSTSQSRTWNIGAMQLFSLKHHHFSKFLTDAFYQNFLVQSIVFIGVIVKLTALIEECDPLNAFFLVTCSFPFQEKYFMEHIDNVIMFATRRLFAALICHLRLYRVQNIDCNLFLVV